MRHFDNIINNMNKKKTPKKQAKTKNSFPKNWVCTNPQLPTNCPHLRIGNPCASHEMEACLECPACIRRFRINPKQSQVNQKLNLLGEHYPQPIIQGDRESGDKVLGVIRKQG